MILTITDWIMNLIQNYGAVSVFVGVLIESVIVPIPSPLIIMGAGALLVPPSISTVDALFLILIRIVLPGAIASTLGSYLMYFPCYVWGKPLVNKAQKFLGFAWEDVIHMEQKLIGNKTGALIFAFRALPIVPLSLISAAAGSIRMNLGTFTLWTFLGSLPRCAFLGYLGWLLHESYQSLAKDFNWAEGIVSGLILVFCIAFVIWLRFKIQKNR